MEESNITKSNTNDSTLTKSNYKEQKKKLKSPNNNNKNQVISKNKSSILNELIVSYQDSNFPYSHENLEHLDIEIDPINYAYAMSSNNLEDKRNRDFTESLSTSIIESDNIEKNQNLLKEKIREITDNFAVVYPLKKMEDFEELNRNYFRLISITAPTKTRFENYKKKYTKKNDNIENMQNFIHDDDNYYKNNPDLKNLENLANYHISNDLTPENLFKKLDHLSGALHQTFRPTWDDYFMKITHAVSDRSNCMKQRIGAIIVNNYRIISTGYNGMSSSLGNCYLGNCPRCNIKARQGENLHNCICIHAEESAVRIK